MFDQIWTLQYVTQIVLILSVVQRSSREAVVLMASSVSMSQRGKRVRLLVAGCAQQT